MTGKFRRTDTMKRKARARGSTTPISGLSIPRIVGEPPIFSQTPQRSNIRKFAYRRQESPTPAEAELRRLSNRLNGGILSGRFKREHVISGRWIVDFFFPEIRLAIEVDGSIHLTDDQIERDRLKEADCSRLDITMLRLTNREIYGDRGALIRKLRGGWRRALDRENGVIGMDADKYLAASRAARDDLRGTG
ncbi:MAG: DUF559 domain-containing protein [Defluviicoccus sp.]|nr:DUF559 domain-containing protein [Defluviicoccus sp.]MDE0386833.1 DUF559 domain-containing protein [Defluviicoccus sp.]